MLLNKKHPELLAPAGSLEALKAAAYFGADAVYCGGPMLQMRASSAGMSLDDLRAGAEHLHALGKKLYVTVNCMTYDAELGALETYVGQLEELGADAVIVSDLGAISVIRRACPKLPIHVSTQANCSNSAAADIYAAMGCARVVPAREMTVGQIAELCAHTAGRLEVEVFVHGAMCMAYSGRCLISSYLNDRSGNRGECTQPCRWEYALCEKKRPGVYLPIEEENGFTEILSSHDMCCIDMLDELEGAGVASYKIEGRMKTAYYVATVVNAYRRMIDGTGSLAYCRSELDKASHRPFSQGFYHGAEGKHPHNSGRYESGARFAGIVTAADGEWVEVDVRGRFRTGDTLEVLSPHSMGLKLEVGPMRDENNRIRTDAYIPVELLKLPSKLPLSPGDILRLSE